MQEFYGTYKNDDLEIWIGDKEYSGSVEAYGEGWFTPGTMYRSNGDPGDPPDGDWDIKEVEVLQIKIWDEDKEDWVIVNDYSDGYEDLVKAFKEYVTDNLEEDDFNINDYEPEHEEEEDW